jgi:hypothetical protein
MYAPIVENKLPQNGQRMTHGDDSGLHVRFYTKGKYDTLRSREEERDVYDETVQLEYIAISIPGGDVLHRVATPADKKRFNEIYRNFKADNGEMPGTDAAELGLTKTQLQRLEGLNIYTAEQLAAVSDSVIQQMGPGGHDMVARAKRFVAVQPVDPSEIEALKAQNKQMQDLLIEVTAQLKELKGKK